MTNHYPHHQPNLDRVPYQGKSDPLTIEFSFPFLSSAKPRPVPPSKPDFLVSNENNTSNDSTNYRLSIDEVRAKLLDDILTNRNVLPSRNGTENGPPNQNNNNTNTTQERSGTMKLREFYDIMEQLEFE